MRRWLRWAQVRRKIDTGRMRDKVNHPDPAAAPLGTDEEAGGASTPLEDIADSVEDKGAEDGHDRASDDGRGRKRR